MRSVWVALAAEDINDQHRQTTLGPFWLLISYLTHIVAFIIIFGERHKGMHSYGAYVALGMLVWIYISGVIMSATGLFQREEGFVTGTTLPISVYVMRLTTQSLIRTGYATIGCLGIILYFGVPITWMWLWSLVAVCVIILASPALIIVFAFGGAYFPDLQFFVQNVIRLGLFLTPIFWTPGGNSIRTALYQYNPFTYFLEIVRLPILEGLAPIRALIFCIMVSAFVWLVALWLLGSLRKRIVFVL